MKNKKERIVKHTPGPWKLENRYDENMRPCGIDVYTKTPTSYSIICRLPDGASLKAGHAWPHQIANARLIAAAPDMLEALEYVKVYFDALGCKNAGTYNLVLNTIKKALGE